MIRDFELSTKFPFGFFRHRRRLPAREAELVVFPKINSLDPGDASIPLDLGSVASSKRGMGRDLLSLRGYQPQDDPRHIDWKATARTQQLTVGNSPPRTKNVSASFSIQIWARKPSRKRLVRERLANEQSGVSVVASEQYERIASLAASLLSHLPLENAEFRSSSTVMPANSAPDGRIYMIRSADFPHRAPRFPSKNRSAGTRSDIERILNESDDSHRFFVTANGGRGLSAEALQRLKIIGVLRSNSCHIP
ncbi:MAG: DUF58 domain-containing protein [Acidobacteria bacterium]|nr:DUF58 domain-containing protein [Acidobacteriota bacterium]